MISEPPRNYTRLAVSIVAAALIVGAAIIASSYLGTTTITRTSTTVVTVTAVPTQLCSESTWNSSSLYTSNSSALPVFLMQLGSTATVCVTYQSVWQGNSSQYLTDSSYKGNYSFSFPIVVDQCGATSTTTSCSMTPSYPPSFSFKIGEYPSSIQPSGSTDYVTVVYTITSLGNSTGFYYPAVTIGDCDWLPMAVGYAASQVNSSDFPSILSTSCPIPEFLWQSTSVSGMNVTYISPGSPS
jgi:hypothetical protein